MTHSFPASQGLVVDISHCSHQGDKLRLQQWWCNVIMLVEAVMMAVVVVMVSLMVRVVMVEMVILVTVVMVGVVMVMMVVLEKQAEISVALHSSHLFPPSSFSHTISGVTAAIL